MLTHRIGNALVISRNPYAQRGRPARRGRDTHDHRPASNIRQRLPGQPRRRKPGRDNDPKIRHLGDSAAANVCIGWRWKT
jgi:hypothetical protein